MDRALTAGPARQGHVQPFSAQTFVQRHIAQCRFPGTKRRVDLILQPVQRRPGRLPRLGRHLAQFAHLQADLALLAQGRDAHILKGALVGGAVDQFQVFLPQRVVHRGLP